MGAVSLDGPDRENRDRGLTFEGCYVFPAQFAKSDNSHSRILSKPVETGRNRPALSIGTNEPYDAPSHVDRNPGP